MAAGTAKEEDLVNKTTGGKKGRGPDVRSIFSYFDTDGSGVVAREEFVESLVKLGVELNRYELNQLYWTMDPDKSGKLSYAEFSRVFFDRRTKMNAEKAAKKKKLMKIHWKSGTGGLAAKELVSRDRREMYTSINTPYKQEIKDAWEQDQERRRGVLYGTWRADRGGFHAKELVDNKSFLNAPAVEAIALESLYIRARAAEAKRDVLQRHDMMVSRKSRVLEEKQRREKVAPEVVVPKFGRWNVGGAVPVLTDEQVDDLNLNFGLHEDGEDGGEDGGEEREDDDADSMVGFRIAPEDWDMEDVKKVVASARR